MKKKLFATILILLLLALPILGANTYSIDLERGSSQYLNRADTASLSITGDLTFEAWIKIESSPTVGAHYMIVHKGSYGGSDRAYSFWYGNDSGTYSFLIDYSQDGSSKDDLKAILGGALSLATWYHIAVTLDVSASTAEFFLDGSSLGTDSGSRTAINDSAANFEVGSYSGNTNYFDGKLDEIKIWNDIRTDPEIDDNQCTELVGDEANLVAYWKLEQDATDSQASGNNDLTEVNSPTYSADVDSCWAVSRRII